MLKEIIDAEILLWLIVTTPSKWKQIWLPSTCSDDIFSFTAAIPVEHRQRRMEGVQHRLPIFIIVIMIISFILRCYCFIYYSCVSKKPHDAET